MFCWRKFPEGVRVLECYTTIPPAPPPEQSSQSSSHYHLLLQLQHYCNLLSVWSCRHPSSSDDVNAMACHCVPVISEKSKQKFSPFSIIWAGLQTREDGRISILFRPIVTIMMKPDLVLLAGRLSRAEIKICWLAEISGLRCAVSQSLNL